MEFSISAIYPKMIKKQNKSNTELIKNQNQVKVVLQLPKIINELNNSKLFNIDSKEKLA